MPEVPYWSKSKPEQVNAAVKFFEHIGMKRYGFFPSRLKVGLHSAVNAGIVKQEQLRRLGEKFAAAKQKSEWQPHVNRAAEILQQHGRTAAWKHLSTVFNLGAVQKSRHDERPVKPEKDKATAAQREVAKKVQKPPALPKPVSSKTAATLSAQTGKITIVVPRHLHEKVKRLAELNVETDGAYFYTPQVSKGRTLWLVHSFIQLGRGSEVHVQAHPESIRAGNALLTHLRSQKNNPDWEFIKVHTHCRGTGKYWFDKFSSQDLDAVKEQLKEESQKFTAMMYSPTHHLVAGHPDNEYRIKVIDSTEQHRQNSRKVESIFNRIAKLKGIHLPEF
ncbi:MAG: hypothetical protein V1722_04750 [Candidatus Micrarchaeota archaeon]